jgi:hypothetical protein
MINDSHGAIDDLMPLVVLSLIWRERQSQLRWAFGLSKHPFFAFKFREFIIGRAREMFTRRLCNISSLKHEHDPAPKQARYGNGGTGARFGEN